MSDSIISPRKYPVSQHFSSMDSIPKDCEAGHAAHTNSSRSAIEIDLKGNIDWDDPSVFVHLGVSNVDCDFVVHAKTSFEQDDRLKLARSELKRIAADASKQETAMYPHLSRIFKFLERLQDKFGKTARIRFCQSSNMQLIIENSDSWDYPRNKPDFSAVLVEMIKNPGNRWRDRHSWCEVKAHASARPKAYRNDDPKSIVIQAADYARLHMSGCPFQLFSVGLLIYGDEFCVGIYDRAGVRFSPSHNIWDDFDTFIRVVRCITTNMMPEQLGQDPTVTTVTGIEHDQWLAKVQENGISIEEYVPGEPVYEVSLGGTDSRRWVTVGTPIWVSLSLFGRGTLVWRVLNKVTLDLGVLKNAWHSGARTPESEIYKFIEGEHPGVARFVDGADVKFPGTELIISTVSLRGRGDEDSANNAILHRVFIFPVGRSLYKARSELELLKGIRAALRGHEFLCSQYILHRDISVGNIMLLSEDSPPAGAEGFLMDLELARYSAPTVEIRTSGPVRLPTGRVLTDIQAKHSRWDADLTKRGAPMTGTLQFMAVELLQTMARDLRAAKRNRKHTKPPIEHRTHHDIESFVWVLIYSLIRRVLRVDRLNMTDEEKALMEDLQDSFTQYFGRSNPSAIVAQRWGDNPWDFVHLHDSFFTDPIRDLINTLDRQFRVKKEEPFTHAAVLSALDVAIRRLS
ncbi:hypothetical protein CERSUDRAFT_76524 [Gelatoporia subvermispora B]|uniref:Protein kinase domain-containing protein n=1 Tax=Ceriporiopsis subvermispora (strain B) TaxID=914234 RepID=M2QNV0_CERS8|nr:hypothetical protein CERSUDRAFT_76524 [Gelatoporia subvermispora B]